MCMSWNINGKTIETQGELVELLGKDYLIGDPSYNGMGLDNPKICLCPVDSEAVAEKLGCITGYDNDMIGGDGGGTIYFKPNKPTE